MLELMDLYHREVGMPEFAKQLDGMKFFLKPTRHAEEQCINDRYGTFQIPDVLRIKLSEVFEIGAEFNRVVKVAVRKTYDEQHDISIVFNVHDGRVRTAWLNKKTDTHRTLDRAKYKRP
jgi:hypothetical protein